MRNECIRSKHAVQNSRELKKKKPKKPKVTKYYQKTVLMLSERINHYALLQLCYYMQCMTTKFNIITSRFFKSFSTKGFIYIHTGKILAHVK